MEEELKKSWSLNRAIKNSFTWDNTDWNYIKSHIVWVLIILLLSYLYYAEVNTARQFIGSSCVHRCQIESYIKDFRAKNPELSITCDTELGTCQISGNYNSEQIMRLEGIGLNFTK